jgi:pimeloyl-ACP methyl ester carboxylesterase
MIRDTRRMTALPYTFTRTSKLEIGYLEWNPRGRRAAVLLHGWPDSAETWRDVAPTLAAGGFRVLAPALRSYSPTRFLRSETFRSGQLAVLGRDLLDLIEALRLENPVLVGHDWGARAVANACGLRANVASHAVMVSVGYGTNDASQPMSYEQSRRYWYQWFMATPRGLDAVHRDRRGFTRFMWETWGPRDWITQDRFDEAAAAFENPDWPAIVLHSYRHRWGFAAGDPDYAADEAALTPAPVLSVPTLVLHGREDYCSHPDTSAGKERFFTGRYERVLLDRVGHFPQREDPVTVAREILRFCA